MYKKIRFPISELIPFGVGRRICPAIIFGMASFELPLPQILYSFDWELPPGTKRSDLSEVFSIAMAKIADLVLLQATLSCKSM